MCINSHHVYWIDDLFDLSAIKEFFDGFIGPVFHPFIERAADNLALAPIVCFPMFTVKRFIGKCE